MVREQRDLAARAATRLTQGRLRGQPAFQEAPWCGGRTRNAASSKCSCLTATNSGIPPCGGSISFSTTSASSIASRRPWRGTIRRVGARGRLGTPAGVVLRLLVLKHLYDWSFDECEREVRGSLVYRAFCRIDGERVPDAKTLIRLAHLLDEPVLKDVLARLVTLGREQRIIRGQRLRVDTTVVETNMHYPTDSTLLADGVRVLTRTLRRLGTRTRAPHAQCRPMWSGKSWPRRGPACSGETRITRTRW
jgi:Transposase domain (DUF772)